MMFSKRSPQGVQQTSRLGLRAGDAMLLLAWPRPALLRCSEIKRRCFVPVDNFYDRSDEDRS
jgi:hypothetical protein